MSWLSGKPLRVLSLQWPQNDPIPHWKETVHRYQLPCSILDDQVLCVFIAHEPTQKFSAVYLAKIHEAIASEGTTAAFVKIATLPNAVHRVALLPDRAGFASLEFTKHTSSITLRIHNWDGTISKEKTTHAAAAYGSLVVKRHAVAVCISSGDLAPQDMYLRGSPDVYHRVDAHGGSILSERRDLTGDHIVVWKTDSDTLTRVRIPQDEDAPINHQANFKFVGDSHIALGGKVEASFGTPSALLKAFHIDNPEEFSRTFTHGPNFEMGDDLDVIAKPGSSSDNAVLANYHHAGNRLTVVNIGLLSGDIDSEPSSNDPSGLHPFWDHPQSSRTIEGTINESLPSISDNRLLVGLAIEPDDERFEKFAVEKNDFYNKILFLYDFDQVRCNELCNLTPAGRTSLESKLREENANAQVRVVQRNFYVSIEEEEDREWLPGSQPPKEWTARIQELYEIEKSRKEGIAKAPVLEFDEAPDAQNGTSRILFIRSGVWLSEIQDIPFESLALTTSGIVHMPRAGEVGHVFYFAHS